MNVRFNREQSTLSHRGRASLATMANAEQESPATDYGTSAGVLVQEPVQFPTTEQQSQQPFTSTPPAHRPKRFSLNPLKHPLLRAPRDSPATRSKAVGEAVKEVAEVSSLKDKTLDTQPTIQSLPISAVKKKQTGAAVAAAARRVARRVSFSPSTDDPASVIAVTSTAATGGKTTKMFGLKRSTSSSPPKRRASLDDGSLGRAQGRKLGEHDRPARRRSLSISNAGIYIIKRQTCPPPSSSRKTIDPGDGKGEASLPRVSRQQAVAARHARVLERIINAGSSVELEELKAKRMKKIGAPKDGHKAVAQQYPVVAPRKVKALKQALLDNDMANVIIVELRKMEIGDPNIGEVASEAEVSDARAALLDLAETDGDRRRLIKEERAARKEEIHKQKVRPKPIRAVCLDCTDAEIPRQKSVAKPVDVRHIQAEESGLTDEQIAEIANVAIAVAESGIITTAISRLGTWLRITPAGAKSEAADIPPTATADAKAEPPTSATAHEATHTALGNTVQYTLELGDDIRTGDVQEAVADAARLGASGLCIAQPLAGAVLEEVEAQLLPVNKVLGEAGHDAKVPEQVDLDVVALKDEALLTPAKATDRVNVSVFSDVSPVSLLTSPGATLGLLGVQQTGAFDAMASASGAAVAYSQGGVEAMQSVQPPLDRMAIFVHWWGFELTLPEPSMRYLGTASSVSSAFLGFLQTMVTTGGVPELLPFIRYISSFMDMEFSAIKSQDKDGRGVVVAATWLMPLALVPRPWDYGYDDGSHAAPQPTTPVSTHPLPSIPPTAPAESHPLPSIPPGGVGMPFLPVRFSVASKVDDATTVTSSPPAIPLSESITPHSQRHDAKIHSHPPVAGVAHSSLDHVLDSVSEISEGGSVRIK